MLPPSGERFDPITGLWANDNGPLADPDRTHVDPAGNDEVTLVGAIPPELADTDEAATAGTVGKSRRTPSQRLRWAILTLLLVGIVVIVVATLTAPAESSQPAAARASTSELAVG